MGRGSMYQYEYFMLIDDEDWDEIDSESFREYVIDIFNLVDTRNHAGRDAYYFGIDSDYSYYVGINTSGGFPCIFVEEYEDDYGDELTEDEEREHKESIRIRVVDGFNKLVKEYPKGTFRYPTSAWTSEIINSYAV